MKVLSSSETLVKNEGLTSPLSFELASSSRIKRLFDLIFAVMGLVMSAPILILAVALIPIQSRGGAIFIQRRVGKDGKIFDIYKLRTMYSGSDLNSFTTAKEDRRLTPLGVILRATNIDELPQLINILKGDMSLIGPRPLSVQETNYIGRHLNLSSSYPGFYPSVRPGLVGLEQINRTKELTYLERFKYNADYERNWNLSVDLLVFTRALLICRHVCIATSVSGLVLSIVSWFFFHHTF